MTYPVTPIPGFTPDGTFDGFSTPDEVAETAAELVRAGQPTIALTDHFSVTFSGDTVEIASRHLDR